MSFLAQVSPRPRRDCGEPYDAPLFQHFLALERKRADKAKRPLLVAAVSLQGDGALQRLSPQAAERVFAGLALCVREVDFIGWLHQDFVAAAVLVQSDALEDVMSGIEDRVTRAVRGQLPADVHCALHVRVMRFSHWAVD